MSHDPKGVIERLEAKFVGLTERTPSQDQPTFYVPRQDALVVLEYLKNDEGFSLLLDVAGVDYFPAHPRFEVVYHLFHPLAVIRLRVKVRVGEGEAVPSVVGLWPGANWPEREAYDLLGIVFDGHPQLTRIYLPDDWEGHPLRKDYPTTGRRSD